VGLLIDIYQFFTNSNLFYQVQPFLGKGNSKPQKTQEQIQKKNTTQI